MGGEPLPCKSTADCGSPRYFCAGLSDGTSAGVCVTRDSNPADSNSEEVARAVVLYTSCAILAVLALFFSYRTIRSLRRG